MSEARSWSDNPYPTLCAAEGRRTRQWSSLRGEGCYQLQDRVNSRLAHRLPGKLAEGHAPHCPFDKLSQWRHLDLKTRTISNGSERVGQGGRKVSHVSKA